MIAKPLKSKSCSSFPGSRRQPLPGIAAVRKVRSLAVEIFGRSSHVEVKSTSFSVAFDVLCDSAYGVYEIWTASVISDFSVLIMPKVHLLDYAAGNIRSLVNAIEKLGWEVEWVKSPEDVAKAEVRGS